MFLIKKSLRSFTRFYYYFFLLIVVSFPLVCLPFLSEAHRRYGDIAFPIISSIGWFCALMHREKQLKAAASRLLRAKIRKFTESDEGLRHIRETIDQQQQENEQIKQQNQVLLRQLSYLKETFIKTRTDLQQLESRMLGLQEDNQRLQAISQEYHDNIKENRQLKKELAEALSYQQALNDEYQATFEEQFNMLDKRQVYISKLEAKVQELMFEIHNLLKLESDVAENISKHAPLTFPDFPSKLLFDLKKVAFRIENIEDAASLSASCTRSPSGHYSLECRQLFDSLREENIGMLFIYSPEIQRAVFGNTLFRNWTGYSVEEFLKAGSDIVVSGSLQWERDLAAIPSECIGNLVAKTRSYGHIPFYYCLTALQRGPLCDHVLGVLYPTHVNAFSN